MLGGVIHARASAEDRKSSRYAITAANLDNLAERGLEQAREHAANSQEQPVLSFVAQVETIVLAEHKDWLLLTEMGVHK
jgi:hypothetical protein